MINVKSLIRWKGNDLWTISPSATAYQALQLMAEKNIGALPVVEKGKLVGIFSERDYARKVILKGKSSKETPVSDLMTEKRIRHLPVMENQALIGIITIGDVVKAKISEQESTIHNLQSYITGGVH